MKFVGKELLHGWQSTIKEFKYRWKICNKKFRLSITPKIHIIFDHLEDQLNITKRGLGRKTDQLIETTHAYVNKRF